MPVIRFDHSSIGWIPLAAQSTVMNKIPDFHNGKAAHLSLILTVSELVFPPSEDMPKTIVGSHRVQDVQVCQAITALQYISVSCPQIIREEYGQLWM